MNDLPFVAWRDLSVALGDFTLGPLNGQFGPGLWHVPGHNGAGKTTFFQLLSGALEPQAGSVRLPGGRPDHHPRARADVAFLPAHPELPDFFTAGEAWRLAAGFRRQPTWDGDPLLHELGVSPSLRLGDGSAGQRKKAELVASLAGNPAVLLLDEVFAPLDAPARGVLAGWLERWRRSRVVLLAHHGELPLPVDGHVALHPG